MDVLVVKTPLVANHTASSRSEFQTIRISEEELPHSVREILDQMKTLALKFMRVPELMTTLINRELSPELSMMDFDLPRTCHPELRQVVSNEFRWTTGAALRHFKTLDAWMNGGEFRLDALPIDALHLYSHLYAGFPAYYASTLQLTASQDDIVDVTREAFTHQLRGHTPNAGKLVSRFEVVGEEMGQALAYTAAWKISEGALRAFSNLVVLSSKNMSSRNPFHQDQMNSVVEALHAQFSKWQKLSEVHLTDLEPDLRKTCECFDYGFIFPGSVLPHSRSYEVAREVFATLLCDALKKRLPQLDENIARIALMRALYKTESSQSKRERFVKAAAFVLEAVSGSWR